MWNTSIQKGSGVKCVHTHSVTFPFVSNDAVAEFNVKLVAMTFKVNFLIFSKP